MKKIIVFLICLFIFPIMSYASECEDNVQISELSNNVNIAYTIAINDNTPVFSIYLTNLTSEMLVLDNEAGKVYKDFGTNNSRLVVKTTSSGRYAFTIYSRTCKTESRTLYVTLPKYNRHYQDSRCKGYENYPLCQRWSEYQANDATFEKDITTLINSNKKEETTEEETKVKKNKKWYEVLSLMFVKFWWAFVIIILAFIALFYVIRAKQKKKEYNFKL